MKKNRIHSLSYIHLWLMITGCWLVTSCDTDVTTESLPQPATDILLVSEVSMESKPVSRSIIEDVGTTDGQLSKIGLYAVGSDGSEYTPLDDSNYCRYAYNSSKWQPDADSPYMRLPKHSSVCIYAWNPAELNPLYVNKNCYVSGVEILSKDDFNATGQTDYLYAPGCRSGETEGVSVVNIYNNPGLSFHLKHALAKISLVIKKSTSTDVLMLKTIKLVTSDSNGFKIGNSTNRRLLNLATGALSGLLPTESLTFEAADGEEIQLDETGKTITALVAPVSKLQRVSFELTIKIDDVLRTFQTKKLTNPTTWQSNYQYKYTILIDDKMSAQIVGDSEVEVYDWATEINEIPIQ